MCTRRSFPPPPLRLGTRLRTTLLFHAVAFDAPSECCVVSPSVAHDPILLWWCELNIGAFWMPSLLGCQEGNLSIFPDELDLGCCAFSRYRCSVPWGHSTKVSSMYLSHYFGWSVGPFLDCPHICGDLLQLVKGVNPCLLLITRNWIGNRWTSNITHILLRQGYPFI